jgi:hypothetical protein
LCRIGRRSYYVNESGNAASRFSGSAVFGGLSSGSAIVNVIPLERRPRVQIAPDVLEPVASTDTHFLGMLQF